MSTFLPITANVTGRQSASLGMKNILFWILPWLMCCCLIFLSMVQAKVSYDGSAYRSPPPNYIPTKTVTQKKIAMRSGVICSILFCRLQFHKIQPGVVVFYSYFVLLSFVSCFPDEHRPTSDGNRCLTARSKVTNKNQSQHSFQMC